MPKLLTIVALLLFASVSLSAQTYNIKGVVEDTINNPLISSTVLLLEKSDSTLVKFTRTELDGSFIFRKVPMGDYLIKTTYVAYIPRTINATSPDGKDLNLGTIKMTELAAELMEVVIKAAKAPIMMRGDTIEYDASTFQVPEGSSVEELLKRLPGIEVDQDGGILADGLAVDRVTVDGKKFFGSDPKAATQNLPAEGISKVQVYDTRSEEENITGAVSEADSKTLNLELKDEFKQGGFGRVTGGVGTENTAEIKGNYNKFNEKIQLSLVGVGNNTGRNGLGWDDYQDFMGSSAFNFSSDGDYGFGGGGGRYITFGGNNAVDIESSIQSTFFSGGGSGGYPENYNGGVNFNYNHKKTEFSSVYYYNQAGLDRQSDRLKRSFLTGYTLLDDQSDVSFDLSKGHRAEVTLEQEIDSLHSFRVEINGAVINQGNEQNADISLSRDDLLTSKTSFDNDLNTSGSLLNGIVFLRKKFKKKGRRFGGNFSYLKTDLLSTGEQRSYSEFFDDAGEVDSTSTINQNTLNDAYKNVYKTNAIFVEPLSKRFFSQTFYNFSHRQEGGDRTVEDQEDGGLVLNENLSRVYDNIIQLHRVGSSIRYSHKGANISVGLAYQQYNLDGIVTGKEGSTLNSIVDKTFINWIPNFTANFSPTRGTRYSASYRVNANEPSINNLQAVVDNSNPLRIFEGNPELAPEISHGISARWSKNYSLAAVRLNFNLNYNFYEDRIIQDETVDENLITYIKPVNYDGGDQYSLWSYISFPVIKGKIKGSTGLSGNYGNSFAFVNEALNETTVQSLRPSIDFTITPRKKTTIYLDASWNIGNTKYSINTTQDQRTVNSSYAVSVNTDLFWGMYLNSSFDYNIYNNDRYGFNQSVPVLNASIYKQFLKGNKAEIRLSVYDAFDQNRSVSLFAGGNSITESNTSALARYFMLSFSYNIKGLKDGVSQNGGWW